MQYLIGPICVLIFLAIHGVDAAQKRKAPLRIAQVAPMWDSVPPTRSVTAGDPERMVYHLTEELLKRGHNVTLFASHDSKTSAKLISHPNLPHIVEKEGMDRSILPFVWLMEQVRRRADEFDVIHYHTIEHMDTVDEFVGRTLTTLYASNFNLDEMSPLFELFQGFPWVALTEDQRQHMPGKPKLLGQVYPGIAKDAYKPNPTPEAPYLAYLARMDADKRHADAIQIAVDAQVSLRIAHGQLSKEQEKYFQQQVKPLVEKHADLVKYLGQIDEKQKQNFMGGALALLILPSDMEEPFELAMIEAMATGTPVVGLHSGSIPEVVEQGVTGFSFKSVEEGAEAVKKAAKLSRSGIRQAFEKRWTVKRMADEYEKLYERVAEEGRREKERNAEKAKVPKQCRKRA